MSEQNILDNPELDKVNGNFSAKIAVPEGYSDATNEDGSPRQIVVQVESDSLRTTLLTLEHLGSDGQAILRRVFNMVLSHVFENDVVPTDDDRYTNLYQATIMEREDDSSPLNDSKVYQEFFHFFEHYRGWDTTTMELQFSRGGEAEQDIKVHVTAPGFELHTKALQQFSNPKILAARAKHGLKQLEKQQQD